jgi:hypothetical protein
MICDQPQGKRKFGRKEVYNAIPTKKPLSLRSARVVNLTTKKSFEFRKPVNLLWYLLPGRMTSFKGMNWYSSLHDHWALHCRTQELTGKGGGGGYFAAFDIRQIKFV